METSQELDVKRYIRLIYKKRYFFAVIALLVTSVIVVLAYALPTKYEASSTVLIERNFLNTILKSIAVTPDIDDRAKAVAVIMKSRPLVLKVMKDLDLDLAGKTEAEVDTTVKELQKNTEVKIEMNKSTRKDMDMFVVSLKHKNPVIARDYVNTLVRRYVEEILSTKRDETFGASKFLLDQIDVFKGKINAIEAKIADMSRRRVGVSASEDRLTVLQKKLSELLLQYTENHPEVIKVKDELEAVKSQMKVQKRPSRTSASDADGGTAQQVMDVRPLSREEEQKIKELERDRDTYRKIYEEMLTALGKSEVSSHIEVEDKGGTFKILEPAILPMHPVSPDRVKIILLGLLAGICVGGGSIILLDSMDKSIKTVETLNAFGFPVLAVIPHIQLPAEIRKTRVKDFALYTFTSIYYVGITAVLILEIINKEMR